MGGYSDLISVVGEQQRQRSRGAWGAEACAGWFSKERREGLATAAGLGCEGRVVAGGADEAEVRASGDANMGLGPTMIASSDQTWGREVENYVVDWEEGLVSEGSEGEWEGRHRAYVVQRRKW
jgi:hypothetical protein